MDMSPQVMAQLNDNSLYRTLGIRIEEALEGAARSRLEPGAELCWPFPGQPHGGVISTLLDTTMAWAVVSELEQGYTCATVNLDIHYTRPAKGDFFTCSARTSHRTGRLSFVRAEVHDAENRLLAMCQGAFRIVEEKKP